MNPSWHHGVMCAFDTETTGTDPETARIVTACVTYLDGSGATQPEMTCWLIDPGCEIPAGAAAIHGITTERARADGRPAAPAVREIAAELLHAARLGIPVVAYNAPYDLTVLDRETARYDLAPFGEEFASAPGWVIDPLVLDKAADPYRKGRRTLTAACEHYGIRIDGAHDSSHDATAAARVAYRIAALHPDIAAMELHALHALQVRAKQEQAASFQDYLRRQGSHEVVDGSWPFRSRAEVPA